MGSGTFKDPIELDPEAFEPYARGHGWDAETIRLLLQKPYLTKPMLVANGSKPGKIVEKAKE